jgi:putative MATE family efflux protein
MSISVSVLIAFVFTLGAVFAPQTLLGFYTEDQEVIEIGSRYLSVVGLSYIPVALATSYIAVLRSIQLIKLTVIATVCALIFKTILGYMLIFGVWIFPELGVEGAGIATASGWIVELILLLGMIYAQKTPLAANPLTFFTFEMPFFWRVLRTSFPALANEMFWSLGITTYNAIYARIGTDAIAAVNINGTIEELGFVVFMGLGNACAVMVGNRIGAGKNDEAYETVRRVIIISVIAAWVVGILVILVRDVVVGLYDLSPSGRENARMLMLVMGSCLWIRMFNFATFIGAFRAGGDTRFALFMEIFSIWFIGVPAAYIGAFVLGLPVYLVYLMVMLEELVKVFFSFWRFRSRKWIHDLVNT